jgi:hypothetical protein
MIWLPDGDEAPDREKHMIQSSKLMLRFVWNPHGFQTIDAMPCHAMPKGEIFTTACDIRNILTEIVSLLGVENEAKGGWRCMRTMQGHISQK